MPRSVSGRTADPSLPAHQLLGLLLSISFAFLGVWLTTGSLSGETICLQD